MQTIIVKRPFSMKTKNGRWTLEPHRPLKVPDVVATYAERHGLLLQSTEAAGNGL